MEVNIETAVRIRPVNCNNNELICVQSNSFNNTINLTNTHSYNVNYALPLECTQSDVYSLTAAPLVKYLLEGYDVSIITLGQSGTGKSYTLYGPGFHFASSETEHGIVPRFLREIFTRVRQFRDRQISIHIMWSQVCGENVQDLLGNGSVECTNILEAFQLIQLGMSNYVTKGAHTLFTLTLEQQWVQDTAVHHYISTVCFADLCGSENIFVYDNNGLMQTIPLDSGLNCLQQCIMSLSDGCNTQCNNNTNDIRYSQSILTTLLKDSFGGRAKTLVIGTASPLIHDYAETLYTMQLLSHASLIKNMITINSYVTYEAVQENCDVFGLQFATNQLFKLVSGAEQLFQNLISNGNLTKIELEQVSQWLTMKQECEECLSDSSDMHRFLERIDEEIEDKSSSSQSESEVIEDDCDSKSLMEKLDLLMNKFTVNTDMLVTKANTETFTTNLLTKDSIKSNFMYHCKGARGRRGSIHSAEELNPSSSMSSVKYSEDSLNLTSKPKSTESSELTYSMKKKLLKQVITTLSGIYKQISNLEETIQAKENLMEQFLKHKETQSTAFFKVDQKCQRLEKEMENVQKKLIQTQLKKNHYLEEKYKDELGKIEKQLADAKSLKNITEDGNKKLIELSDSIESSKKQLEKLIKHRRREERRKRNYEIQLREEKSQSKESVSNTPKDKSILISSCSSDQINKSNDEICKNVDVSTEELEFIRHEIRNLRKTREFLLEQRCKIETKFKTKNFYHEVEEQKILQYEEAIEAIDIAIEYKNEIICGRKNEKALVIHEEQVESMLMERLMNLSENEMRILLHKYFQKVVDLRSTGKKLEMQVVDIETKNETLACHVQNLSHNLQQVRLEADRRIVMQQQQHESMLHVLMRILANDGNDKKTVVVMRKLMDQASSPNQLKPPASQAKVTREKNKIFIQQK